MFVWMILRGDDSVHENSKLFSVFISPKYQIIIIKKKRSHKIIIECMKDWLPECGFREQMSILLLLFSELLFVSFFFVFAFVSVQPDIMAHLHSKWAS